MLHGAIRGRVTSRDRMGLISAYLMFRRMLGCWVAFVVLAAYGNDVPLTRPETRPLEILLNQAFWRRNSTKLLLLGAINCNR